METSPAKRRKLSASGGPLLDGRTRPTLDAAASSAGTFRPSTFILESEELLSEVKLDYAKSLHGVDEFLHRLKSIIEHGVEPHEPIPIHEASVKSESGTPIAIPFPDPKPTKDSQLKLSLEKPSAFNVAGSYVSKTMIKPQGQAGGNNSHQNDVDMVVEMPQSMFQEKDYLNMRYFYKRAYFLANLARAVSKPSSEVADRLAMKSDPLIEYLHDNPLLPILVLHPDLRKDPSQGQSSLDARIRVIPCAPETLFPPSKLSSSKNCLRPAGSEEKKTTEESLPPTPFYNSTLRAEGLYLSYLKLMRRTEKISWFFKPACVFGRVWLRQRGFGGSISRGGFGHFEWSLLLALLLQNGGRKGSAALSPALSSHQMFKATLQILAKADLVNQPFVLGELLTTTTDGEATTASIRVAAAAAAGAPVLYDAARQLNFAFKMSPWSAALLQRHAKWTLDLLNDDAAAAAANQFTPTFISRADVPLQMFDLAVRIQCPGVAASAGSQGGSYEFSDRVYRVLKRALGNRAQLIHVQLPLQRSWSVSEHGPDTASAEDSIVVGIVFDPVEMARKVDHGPSAEDKAEAKKFRQFWGERAELRRFKDGSIEEALIWTKNTAFGLCQEIVSYILELHLKLGRSQLDFFGNGFLPLISAKPSDAAAYTAANEAFATLEQDIRALEDLPLHVRQIAPTAAELRWASVKAPVLNSVKAAGAYVPMDVVISFEASGKWPDNLAAIQRTKVAFLQKIGSLLEERAAAHSSNSTITTRIGLEDAKHDAQNLAFLDIVYEDTGAVFRLRVHSDLEESILDRQTRDKTLEQHARAESSNLLATARRMYKLLPLQNQTISTYCTRWPALSPSIRLAKRWFASHKLANHFLPETIELLVLHAFAGAPSPWHTTVPSSASAGLLRTLHLLAHWDWRSEPLIVDPSSSPSSGGKGTTTSTSTDATEVGIGTKDAPAPIDREAVATRLAAWRKTLDPAMNRTVLVVATPSDPTGTAFTTVAGRAHPSTVAAARMTALARSACRLVRGAGVELDARRLFAPALGEYDVLVRLDKAALKAVSRNVRGGDLNLPRSAGKYRNVDGSRERVPVAAGDVGGVLVERLGEVYGNVLVFFYGGGEGEDDGDGVVGGVWNPMVQRRSFRVNLPCSFKPAAVMGKKKKKKKAAASSGADGEERGEEEEDEDEMDVDSSDHEDKGGEADLVEVNREAILAEIARIGSDLIESVEVMSG